MLTEPEQLGTTLAAPLVESASPKGSTSRISNLPHEILSFIFKLGYDSQSLIEEEDIVDEDNIGPSLRVSQVSQKWRSIAIATATIWTTLSTSPPRSMRFYEMLRDRSNVALLDIIIRDPGSGYTKHARALFVFSIALAHRWRSLEIEAGPSFQKFALPILRNLSCPHLKSLDCSRAHPATPPTHILAVGAPRLTHWKCTDLSGRPPLAALTHLKFFSIYSIPCAELRVLFQETSSTLLVMELMLSLEEDEIVDDPVVMPVLESASILAMAIGRAQNMVTALMSIIAPRLDTIIITSSEPLPQQLCVSVLSRWNSSLNYPKLSKLGVLGDVGPYVLRLFPTVSTLLLPQGEGAKAIGRILDPDHNHFSSLLPRLAVIGGLSESEADVQPFLAARTTAGLLIPAYRVIE